MPFKQIFHQAIANLRLFFLNLKGNADHVPGVTMTDEKPGSPPPEEEMQQSSGSGDKSVLQAKLTNLAIQIGYGGKTLFWLINI